MADKVGKKTGLVTNYGRPVYEMEDGSRVSEISDTFKYKGKIINIPTIHGGRQYSQNELIDMLDAKDIKPTSTHSTFEDAEKAARERSDNMTMHKAKASGGVMMAQQGQTTLPMTQATSAPQGGGPKAANPAAVNPLVAPQQQSARPGEVDPRDGAVQEVAQEMQKKQAPAQPAIQQVGQEMVMPTPPAPQPTGGLAAPAQPPAVPMMAKGGMKDDAPEGLAVMIGLGAPTPSYEEAAEGNPPPGATKEEVADDQLVLLSEGELVVPANVVRYHGLGTYEGMRREALMGLQDMESNGQIEYVSGGAEKADPVDDNGGLIKAQAGTTLMGTGLSGRLPSNPNEEVQLIDPIFTVPQAASARFVTTPGQQRGIGSPTTDVTPLTMRGNLPAGAQIDPVTGLLIYPSPEDKDTQPTPTIQQAGITSVVAPNVGQYAQDPDPAPVAPGPAPDPDPAPAPAPAPAPTQDSGGSDRDDNAGNVAASSAHGYSNVKTDLKGLGRAILGPFGNLLGGDEGVSEKDVYGKVAVGTGAVYGRPNIEGAAEGTMVAQGHSPITGQRMPVYSDRPSGEFFEKSLGKALGIEGYEDFRGFNVPSTYDKPTPLGEQGIASTLDKAISNTKGFDITIGDPDDDVYEKQDITPEMLGFDRSQAGYSQAAKNSGVIGNDSGDIVATTAGVGVLNDSNQVVTNKGTVVQVTFADGSKGSLLGSALENKDVITRYNAEKGIDSRRGSSSSYFGDITPSDRRGTATEQTNAALSSAAQIAKELEAQGKGMSSDVTADISTIIEGTGMTKASTRSDDDDRPSGRQYGGFDRKTVQEETQKTQESYEEAAGINQPAPEPKQDEGSGGGDGGGRDKVICTAMHEMAGFGSYRNKLWQTYAKKAYRNDNVQLGYHKVFANMAKTMYNKPTLAKVLGYFARNRTVYIRNKMRNKPNSLGSIILWSTIEGGLYLLGAAIARGWIKKKKL